MKILINNQKIELHQNDYLAQGGEAQVFKKHLTAYKIYHDPSKMIPVGKIQELSQLKLPNVLTPSDVIYDIKGQPIGFSMPFVSKTEYLCRLFTKGFRDKNGISSQNIADLVKRAQDTLKTIHSQKFLVVDYNPFNFLTNATFDEYYHIDTDSWQTPSYKATAIMDSIRDPKVSGNKFTESSDWYSWAIVMFELYMGTHPYKGRHPDFGRDWQAMMDAGVSVFNKKSSLPPNCQDWSVIPKGHLKWFEKVFEYGERIAPPDPDQVVITTGPVQTKIIASNAKFELTLFRQYGGIIGAIRDIDGSICAYCATGIHIGSKKIASLTPATGYTEKRIQHDFIPVQGDLPYSLSFNSLTGKLSYINFKGTESAVISTNGYFIANRRLYVVIHGSLVEMTFSNLGAKVVVSKQIVANIIDTHKIFDGMVVQDMLGTCRIAIPYKVGASKTIHVPELDGKRIVDAKYMEGGAIVIAEDKDVYERQTLIFDKSVSTYTIRVESNVVVQDVNFTVLDKGLCVAANGDSIELFYDNSAVKTILESPLTSNQSLYSWGNKIYVVNGDSVYNLSMK